MQTEELPSEYVSIRSIWLSQINRCNDAISKMAVPDVSQNALDYDVGYRNVVYSIDALYHCLVDYGEARVRSDIDRWRKKVYHPEFDKIWSGQKSERQGWSSQSRLSIKLFDEIIQVLNKYNMLFPEQPQGYSNVEMKSVG